MTLLEIALRLRRMVLGVIAFVREEQSDSSDSAAWESIEAIVYSCKAGYRDRMVGVELWYEYHVEDDYWSGSCWVQLPDRKFSESYAAAHPPGSRVRIKYCPADAGRSVMLEKDQLKPDWTAAWIQAREL